MTNIEKICKSKGIKLTAQRKTIAQIIENSVDHPDVEEIFLRASQIDAKIGIATVYRAVKLFKELQAIEEHDFKNGRARYEKGCSETHHHHLIDVETGKVIEFQNEKLEILKQEIAKELGYELVDHRLELYGVLIKK